MMDQPEKTTIRHYLDWSRAGKPALWRYALVVVLGFVVWVLGGILPIRFVFEPLGIDALTNPVALYYTFLPGFVGIPLLVWLLLRRPPYSVALPAWPPRLADYGLGVLFQWLAMVVMYLLAAEVSYRGFEHLSAGLMLLVAAALVGIFIQTGLEELFFRGLLAQATHRLSTWLPLVVGVQAYLFASMHLGNLQSEGETLWKWVLYLTPALAWGWIAWRTGSLVFPMALHFGNNAFLQLFVATQGDVIEGIAPFVATPPTVNPVQHLALFTLGQVLITLLLVEALWRRRAARVSVFDPI